ncbi:MAG: hypothetical protein M1155_02160 [Patescibacteria group bacterium]|nr:hypothetical protein [Patescibacteria group bacterium]
MRLSELKKDNFLMYPFLVGIAAAFIALISAWFGLSKITNLLILHFNSYKGIDYLGDKNDVFNITVFPFAVIIINFLLAKKLYYKERFLAYFLSFSSALFSLLILIGVFVIISIN